MPLSLKFNLILLSYLVLLSLTLYPIISDRWFLDLIEVTTISKLQELKEQRMHRKIFLLNDKTKCTLNTLT